MLRTIIYPTILWILAALSPLAAMAQEVGLDDGVHIPEYRLQAGFDGNRSTGNFEMLRMNSRGSLLKRWDDHLVITNSYRYSYMKSNTIKFSDDFRDFTVITFRPFAFFTPYLIGLYHNSFTRFIDQRWMVGAGGALNFFRSKIHQVKLGMSASYEWTTLDGRPPPFSPPDGYGNGCIYRHDPDVSRDCQRQMWRFIPRLVGHHKLADKKLILDYELLWVVDPFNPDDERVFMGVTTSLPILSWLRVYAHYDVSYESIVLKHRERLDSHLSFGINVTAQKD